MLNVNPSTIENVSIKELKETEEVLKRYNNHINKSEEERKEAVISESKGKISSKSYDEHIEQAKSFTLDGTVPNPTDWQQIRTLYREVGNQKIADARARIEKLSEEYSGTATVNDERYGKITPKQAVKNYDTSNKRVEITKRMGVVLALAFGIIGFLGLVLLVKLVLNDALSKISLIVLQLVGGLAGIVGLVAGGWLGRIVTKLLLKKQKEERDYFEMVKINNQVVISKLLSEIKLAEENKKRIEAQYGVEILAKTDFSSQVPFVKKPLIKEENIQAVEEKQVEKTVLEEKNEQSEKIEEQEIATNEREEKVEEDKAENPEKTTKKPKKSKQEVETSENKSESKPEKQSKTTAKNEKTNSKKQEETTETVQKKPKSNKKDKN